MAKLDDKGRVIERYHYAERRQTPSLIVKHDGATPQAYRVIADHLGSVRLVVRLSDGQVVQRLDYDAFGAITLDTNPGFQPFGFVGGLQDRDTGLVRFGTRDYDPATGRWVSKEPLGFGGALNWYEYAGGDPVNWVDLDGNGTIYVHFDGYPITIDYPDWIGGGSDKLPLGHAGVVIYDDSGITQYHEFGRYQNDRAGRPVSPDGQSCVRRRTIPDLKLDENGTPTKDSLKNLIDYLSTNIGKGYPVSYVLYSKSDFDVSKEYIAEVAKNPPDWSLFYNCKEFGEEAATAGCPWFQSCR